VYPGSMVVIEDVGPASEKSLSVGCKLANLVQGSGGRWGKKTLVACGSGSVNETVSE
jgi:hypothetical protein